MTRHFPVFRAIAATVLALATFTVAGPSTAQEMVSISGSTVNMRAGPGTDTEVLWELQRGYPLVVVKRQGNWLEVRDFEDDRGWVARSLVGRVPHMIVKVDRANIRSGPGSRYRVVGKAEYGELLRTLERRADWVRVRRAAGEIGWVARRLLWGW
jgi:SH3-like domain-containing protein